MSLQQATAKSVNTAFVALASEVGTCKVRQTEEDMGVHMANGNPMPKYTPSIVLGATEVSPMTMANAYGVIAAGGKLCTPDAGRVDHRLQWQGREDHGRRQGQLQAGHRPGRRRGCRPAGQGHPGARRHRLGQRAGERADRRRQDRDLGRQQADLVRRLHPAAGHRGLDGHAAVAQQLASTTSPWRDQTYNVVYGAAISAPIWKGIMDFALQNQPNVDFPQPSAKIQNGALQPFSPSPIGYSVANATAILQSRDSRCSRAGPSRPTTVLGSSPEPTPRAAPRPGRPSGC